MREMTIGARAREAGVNVETVRYYQRLGVLEVPGRPPGGIRRYGGEARVLAADKLALVESRISDLERMRGALKGLIGRCDRRRGRVACPIIESLASRG